MPSLFRAFERLAFASVALLSPLVLRADATAVQPVANVGNEYLISGGLPGDQIKPTGALGTGGGFIFWQDNSIDGDGWGIAGVRLDQAYSPAGSVFRVNAIGLSDQVAPRAAALAGGGYAVVWQGGPDTSSRIYVRLLKADGTFTTANDIMVNTDVNTAKITPAIAALSDGSLVVVWASYGQDDAANSNYQQSQMLGIYAQRLDSNGNKLGGEFLVNQSVALNQKTPAVSALADGSFAVSWITELVSGIPGGQSVDGINVMYRKFSVSGVALTDEIQANDHLNYCSVPQLSPTLDGGFLLVWGEKDAGGGINSLDVIGRSITADGTPADASFGLNTYLYGDQFSPQVASSGGLHLTVWSSLAQDGNKEGVYARFVSSGSPAAGEFKANTSVVTPKQDPAILTMPSGGFLVVWDSYAVGGSGFEIYAQRYQNSWPVMSAPTVSALATNQLLVSWTPLQGFDSVTYQLYEDGNAPISTTFTNWTSPANLLPGTLHTFRVGYTVGGVASPAISSPGSGVTLGATVVSSQIGLVAQTVSGGFLKLSWATTYGSKYQLQYLSGKSWVNFGAPRKAVGKIDYVFVKEKKGTRQYRVVKLN